MELSVLGMILGLLLLAVPAGLAYYFRLRILNHFIVETVKMGVGVVLLGIVLHYVFMWNNGLVNLAWILLMAVLATVFIVREGQLSLKTFLLPVLTGVAASLLVFGLYFVFAVLGLKNGLDARYLIPVAGLMVAMMVVADGKALATYYMGLRYHGQLYYYLRGNGATHAEATQLFLRRALDKAALLVLKKISSTVVGMAPVVLFAMLLSGVSIVAAVEYQVLLLILCFAAAMTSVLVTLLVARKYAFDEYGQLRQMLRANDEKMAGQAPVMAGPDDEENTYAEPVSSVEGGQGASELSNYYTEHDETMED